MHIVGQIDEESLTRVRVLQYDNNVWVKMYFVTSCREVFVRTIKNIAVSIKLWFTLDFMPWFGRNKWYIIPLLIVFLIGSCCYQCAKKDPGSPYQFLYDVSCVEKIDICKKTVETHYNGDPVEVLLTVDKEEHSKVFAAIQELKTLKRMAAPSESIGLHQVRIYYKNGEIEILGMSNNAYIREDGTLERYGNGIEFDEGFEDLIQELLGEKEK